MPRPDISLGLIAADTPIIIAMVRDRISYGAIHPAYLLFGIGLIAEQCLEVLSFDTPVWRAAAQTMFQVLS